MADDHLIRLPQLGLTMTEGMLVEWLIKPGNGVRAGEVLYVVETDKIANEILADRDGVLESILVQVDETVPVGATLGVWAGGPQRTPQEQADNTQAQPVPATVAASPARTVQTKQTATTGARIVATPHARKLAREHAIDLASLGGSGPRGRIVAADILAASPTDTDASTNVSTTANPEPRNGTPLRGVQKAVATQMLRSHQEIPHFHLTASAEISELLWLHEGLKQKLEVERITLTHWIATAVGLAIANAPKFRTVLVDDHLFVLPGSHVGVAVAIENGIHAPVARDLGDHGLTANATQIEELIQQAHAGTLSAQASSGAATTVTNLGSFNIQQVFPLIVPGQSSILGVGRQQSLFRPNKDGEPVLRKELGLVLGGDHRVLNGADGARLLQSIVGLLEDPLLILVQARI